MITYTAAVRYAGALIPGAMRAGCAAAFVARPGKALYPLADAPDIVGPDLRNVADQIVKRDTPK